MCIKLKKKLKLKKLGWPMGYLQGGCPPLGKYGCRRGCSHQKRQNVAGYKKYRDYNGSRVVVAWPLAGSGGEVLITQP